MRRRDWQAALAILAVIGLFALSLAWAKFSWDECRKDPDHTFWHCVAVIDS